MTESPSDAAPPKAVVFDLGGVLIDWNPRYVYREAFGGREDEMETFLREVCSPEWNHKQDEGRPWAEAIAELSRERPEFSGLIRLYWERWPDMIRGAIDGTVRILSALREAGVPLYSITNWSHETYPIAEARFPFLAWFKDVAVSGREGVAKPDPRLYRILLERNGLAASDCLFVDDVPRNVEAARSCGLRATTFVSPERLAQDLTASGLRFVLQEIPKP